MKLALKVILALGHSFCSQLQAEKGQHIAM